MLNSTVVNKLFISAFPVGTFFYFTSITQKAHETCICVLEGTDVGVHARIQKIFSGKVQIPRRGLTENFNMAKTNNLAIPWEVRTPCPPLWIRPWCDQIWWCSGSGPFSGGFSPVFRFPTLTQTSTFQKCVNKSH